MKTCDRVDVLSLAATGNGTAFGTDSMEGYSICASWAGGGSPVGVLKLQACNNPFTNNVNQTPDPAAVWVDITGSSYSVSADGNTFWNVTDVYYRAFRIVYTKTSGTATGSVYIFAKGIQ